MSWLKVIILLPQIISSVIQLIRVIKKVQVDADAEKYKKAETDDEMRKSMDDLNKHRT